MNAPLFALIDCNNFFVSCEKVFRPDLEGKPVVVLSSGDGCVVARSNEAKALGVQMAGPAFKHKRLFEDHGVVSFSANFELYGDISRRITEILTSITPRLEVYSIDESFLDVSQLPVTDFEAWGREVRRRILQWVGVPVRIGIAPTKTLAKLASDYSKKDPKLEGVVQINSGDDAGKYLKNVSIEDVWGVGWRRAPQLRALGLSTAYDLAQLTPSRARTLFKSVQGERLVRELQGVNCYPLELIGKNQKMISATRTFGQDTNEPHILEAAVASFVARSANKLRAQKLVATRLSIFLTTHRKKPGYKSWYKEIKLDQPTADTGAIMSAAHSVLLSIYDKQYMAHRGGVTLSGLLPENHFQTDLLGKVNVDKFDKETGRMNAVDKLNQKYGARTVRIAAEDLGSSWEPKHNFRSPRYTTNWAELPAVIIK